VAIALAVVAGVAFLAVEYLGRATVTPIWPAPGGAVAATAPAVAFALGGADTVRDLRVAVDGKDRTGRLMRDGDRLMLRPGRLAEGPHTVEVRLTSRNLLSRSVSRRWGFAVDTTPPRLAVAAPGRGSTSRRRAVAFRGTADPWAQVRVAFRGGEALAAAGGDGRWSTRAELPEGDVRATITAVDGAGNASRAARDLVVDTTAPVLAVTKPAHGEQLTETDQPLVYGSVGDEDLRHLTFVATVNGRRVEEIRGSAAVAGGGGDAGYVEAAATVGVSPLQVDGDRFALAIGQLAQGRNEIVIAVRDAVGNTARRRLAVLVDSTDRFGAVDLVRGARGADVAKLQERLEEAGFYSGKPSSVFDRRTAGALNRFQKERGMRITGRLDERTRKAMLGRVVVHIGQRKLRLIRGGEVVRTYRVAVGVPQYPTPTGTYSIVTMEKDPTWSPPDSPWAEGLGPIPAGPGNPLGTRWIGTSSPAIGIHGTYASGSIGSAASHGCIRMHIPEVEALYEEVAVGMEVRFVA
jgi:lipoprotein-anchoring transpeptidase ErfK/SrfK